MQPVTDPAILAELEGGKAPVADPKLLAQLNGPANLVEFGKDIARTAGGGLITGAMAIPDVANAARKGFNKGLDYLLPPTEQQQAARSVAPQPIGSPEALSAAEKALGTNLAKNTATTPEGKMIEPWVRTAAEFVPMSVATGGGAIVGGAIPGLASETAGQLTKGKWYEPIARIMGGVGAAPIATRVATPLPSRPAHQRLVDTLENEGVTSLTAGQRTGNEALKYQESALGNAPFAGGKANAITRQGQEQFTEAATRRAGYAGDAGPEALAANNARLTDQFRDLSARNTLTPDNQFITDLTQAVRAYRNVPNSQQRAMIQGYIDDIVPHVNAGAMPGVEYQAMRSRMSRQANNNRQNDPDLAEALRGMRNALDNAMGRSITDVDREAWNAARREWGAQKVIEKAASRAGEATAEGMIVPSNLRNIVAAENNGMYARGQGPFAELARAGEAMKPMPQSGTAPRSAFYNIANFMTAGAAPAMAGRVLMSRPIQAYLANQAAPMSSRDQVLRALLDAGAQQRQTQ